MQPATSSAFCEHCPGARSPAPRCPPPAPPETTRLPGSTRSPGNRRTPSASAPVPAHHSNDRKPTLNSTPKPAAAIGAANHLMPQNIESTVNAPPCSNLAEPQPRCDEDQDHNHPHRPRAAQRGPPFQNVILRVQRRHARHQQQSRDHRRGHRLAPRPPRAQSARHRTQERDEGRADETFTCRAPVPDAQIDPAAPPETGPVPSQSTFNNRPNAARRARPPPPSPTANAAASPAPAAPIPPASPRSAPFGHAVRQPRNAWSSRWFTPIGPPYASG